MRAAYSLLFVLFFLPNVAHALISRSEFVDKLKDLGVVAIPILVFGLIFAWSERSRRSRKDVG